MGLYNSTTGDSREARKRKSHRLREHGKDITYLLFPDAGHTGGGVPANLLKRWAAIEAFLGKYLGGRVEAPGESERWESLLK